MNKHRAFTFVEALVVVLIVAVLAAILLPVFARQRETPHRGSCSSNLKQIALGYLQYTQDFDEKLPPTQNASGGWADLVFPYVKTTQIFQCPTDDSRTDKTSDYFFNSRLSSVSMEKIPAPNLTISLGDNTPDQPLNANLSQLPTTWLHDSDSPANRHLDGAYYAFADGHAKWLKPEDVTLDKPALKKPTFLVK